MSAPSCCLVVLDGWGLAEPGPGNAVAQAQTPVFDSLVERYPSTTLVTCGRAVGLPDGQMGNSEVGHLNLGAGTVVRQDLTRIDDAVRDGEFDENPVLLEAMRDTPRLHLVGLVSDGGVHSSMEHLHALIGMAGDLGVPDVVVHAFTDGRDTAPDAGAACLETVERWCEQAGNARVGSVVGRFYAMDRDRRWDRVQAAWQLLAAGEAGHREQGAAEAVRAAYRRGESDEFIVATAVGKESAIRPGDSVIAFNFRPDRMREITAALADPDFDGFERPDFEPVTRIATLTRYVEGSGIPAAFAPERPATTLPREIARAGGGQVHVAETEKYPHVTYFFGGGEEEPVEGERRELVPSPRDVKTYDERPEMSAAAAAEAFREAWGQERPRFGIINFANPDMVGHTGVIPAAVAAVEEVDRALGSVVETVTQAGGVLVVTADHGNAEEMLNPDGSANTAHSLNPVPVVVTDEAVELRDGGALADVAPTVLDLLGIAQPEAMTGRSLIKRP